MWCKEHYKCKTLAECRQYVNEWISGLIEKGLSASTIKQYACAVAKMYQCSTKEFIKTPPRLRANIKRSRGKKVRDAHFSEKNNKAMSLLRRYSYTNLKKIKTVTESKK